MKWLTGAMTAAALFAPAALRAQPGSQDFCDGLKRVLEAAEIENGFLQLERARGAPPNLGFRYGCRATGNQQRQFWLCNQNLASEEMSGEALAARTAACLPEAARGRTGPARDWVFKLPHARIHIYELGGPGAKVGRIVEFVVEAVVPEARSGQ